MDPVLDGAGGGFGKNQGLPVREVLAIFARAAEEGKMRSVRTVIRVSREQIEARGDLDTYPKVTVGFIVLAALAATLAIVGPEAYRESAWRGAGVLAAIAGVLGFGVWQSRRERVINRRQVALIREGALDALRTLGQKPELQAETLDWSEKNALDKLRRRQSAPPWA